MIEIKDLLSNFSNILLSEEAKTESIRQTIKEVVGIDVSRDEIKIKGDTVYLNIKPIYKSEIYLKKDQILKSLGKSFIL